MTTKMIDFRGYYPLLGGSEYDFGLLLIKKLLEQGLQIFQIHIL